jgi:uncharacterized protein involved in outer membrane biogenesis
MNRFAKPLRSHPYLALALGCVVALAAFVVAFDWNWLRGPLVSYLTEQSGREVRIGDLHVDAFSLEPTVRLRDVYVQNAPWAGERPFATAAEASFTVSLKSLWERRPIISRLVLVDADVDMQRQADGLRNWRLTRPHDRTPGRLTIQTLEPHRTTIRFVNRAIELEFVGRAQALDKPTTDGLSSRITFEGRYQGAPYAGEALTAGILSFRGSGVVFPARGELKSRDARVEVDGLFTDLFDLGTFDAKIRVSGSTLSRVHPFLRIRPPRSRPFRIDAQLTQAGNVYEFRQLEAKVGTTDLAGEATYDRSGDRPRIRAVLSSEAADIVDLRALLGMGGDAGDRRAVNPANAKRSGAQASAQQRVFSAKPFRIDRLNAFDAALELRATKLRAATLPMLDSLRVATELAGGVLRLKTLDIGAAGGHIVGALTLDAHEKPVTARTHLELRALKLERLAPWIATKARAGGSLRGAVELAGQGDSIASILGNATGSIAAQLEDGRISNAADAKLGLNFGKLFALKLRGDREIAIHCGAVAFNIQRGTGKSREIVLDTGETHTDGIGTLDLRHERWELLLTPQPRKPGLLTRHASIRATGSFRDAEVSIEERVPLRSGDAPGVAASEASPAGCATSR